MSEPVPNLSLRDLEYVVSIADLLHFGRAAKQCGVTQPALSGQVKKLEALLGTRIFDRSSRAIALTPTGGQIVERARFILRDVRALIDLSGESVARSRPFRIGAIQSLAPFIFSHLIRPIMDSFPDASLRFFEDDVAALRRSLKDGVIDGAFVSGVPDDRTLVSTKLFFEPFVLVHKHDEDSVWPPKSDSPPIIVIEADLTLNEEVAKLTRRYPSLKLTSRRTSSFEMLR